MPIYITVFESQITKNETALESIFRENMDRLSRKNKKPVWAKYGRLWAILNKTAPIETLLNICQSSEQMYPISKKEKNTSIWFDSYANETQYQ